MLTWYSLTICTNDWRTAVLILISKTETQILVIYCVMTERQQDHWAVQTNKKRWRILNANMMILKDGISSWFHPDFNESLCFHSACLTESPPRASGMKDYGWLRNSSSPFILLPSWPTFLQDHHSVSLIPSSASRLRSLFPSSWWFFFSISFFLSQSLILLLTL